MDPVAHYFNQVYIFPKKTDYFVLLQEFVMYWAKSAIKSVKMKIYNWNNASFRNNICQKFQNPTDY